MNQIRVICPNHGIISKIEMACMWVGKPPEPETECAFCPKCGSKTVIERDPPQNTSYISSSLTQKELKDIKRKEIEFYRKKYFGDKD